MEDFQIFIRFNSKSYVFWVNHGTDINELSRDICIKFNLPYIIEYTDNSQQKIKNIKTPFYLICNAKVLDRCNFKTLNDFSNHWPKYMIQKDCNIWVHLIHTSKLWDKYKVENKKECIYNIDKKNLFSEFTNLL